MGVRFNFFSSIVVFSEIFLYKISKENWNFYNLKNVITRLTIYNRVKVWTRRYNSPNVIPLALTFGVKGNGWLREPDIVISYESSDLCTPSFLVCQKDKRRKRQEETNKRERKDSHNGNSEKKSRHQKTTKVKSLLMFWWEYT